MDDATNARRIRRTRGVIFFFRLLATDLLPRFLAALDFAAVLVFVEEVWATDVGAEDNNIVPESGKLLEHWEQTGPKLLWSVWLSEGHSGPADPFCRGICEQGLCQDV